MEKITIKLSNQEWQMLTSYILCNYSYVAGDFSLKYYNRMRHSLMKQVYIKLHNKLHSLKLKNNNLNLTHPESCALSLCLQEKKEKSYLDYLIISEIDVKIS